MWVPTAVCVSSVTEDVPSFKPWDWEQEEGQGPGCVEADKTRVYAGKILQGTNFRH